MLEFALCGPILLYLLVAAADFGRYYSEYTAVGQAALTAARGASSLRPDDPSPTRTQVQVESFCECPNEPGLRVACESRACTGYGEPARYSQATAKRPFSFMAGYPGFPRSFDIRRQAGVRTR